MYVILEIRVKLTTDTNRNRKINTSTHIVLIYEIKLSFKINSKCAINKYPTKQ